MPHWDSGLKAKSIVYMHGIGNKPPEAFLKRSWDHALFAHDFGPASTIAYWADIRYKSPLGAGEAATDDLEENADEEFAESTVNTHQELLERGRARYSGEDQDSGLDQEQSQFAAEYLAEFINSEQATGNEVDIIGPIRRAGFKLITKVFIPDAHAYFFKREQRELIQERLRTRLRAAEPPMVVVAHSLGSLVAYDVLHEPEFAELQIAAFVTFGSQLGVREIREHVRNPQEVPGSVIRAWHNFLDPDDFSPMKKLLGVFYRPYAIEDLWVSNVSPNSHDGINYLNDPSLQKAVHRVLKPPEPS